MLRYQTKVFADYHQFYLWDAGIQPEAPENYTDDDVSRMVKLAPHILAIRTVRNGLVPVDVEVHEFDPGHGSNSWDHVVEAEIDLPTGRLQIHECTGGPVLEFQVPPGHYATRIHFSGMSSIASNGLDGDDKYGITLWPGRSHGLHVTKRWLTGQPG